MKTKLLFTGLITLTLTSCDVSSVQTTDATEFIAADTTLVEAAPEIEEPASAWQYSEQIDEMTDKNTYCAYTVSTNEVTFDFPYEGGSSLTFTIRDSPQYGKDMYIRISKGQFNAKYNGTKIKVRFDDDPAFDVYCNESSDLSMDILFLRGYNKILPKLKKAKTMKIAAEFFNEGVRTFTFDVEGLEWNH